MVAVRDCPTARDGLLSDIVGPDAGVTVAIGNTPLKLASAENGDRARTLIVRSTPVERRAIFFITESIPSGTAEHVWIATGH